MSGMLRSIDSNNPRRQGWIPLAGIIKKNNTLFMNFYAHSKKDSSIENWHLLEEHLEGVACLASEFAKPFGAQKWGELAGRTHDLGKGTRAWQAYLRKRNNIKDKFSSYYKGEVKHADVGARHLYQHSQEAGKLLSYAVAGHHGGLPSWVGVADGTGLKARLKGSQPSIEIPLPSLDFPEKPPFHLDENRRGYQFQFFTRMLFSCLVDADYLDTERNLDADRASGRGTSPPLEKLHKRFRISFDKLRKEADASLEINKQRELVLDNCMEAAQKEPGLISLTVPTGGGKTLASLAFALEHAKKHGKVRIIYVIPFTSIIEQNARVFRNMVGKDAVLEHHCNYIQDKSDWKIRLATDNWDSPIVVTTNVQFFDSFHASRPARCRKLHNVANSIVIFDEVQAIPAEKLSPCIEVIRELSFNYGVTSLLCTATQPALEYPFKSGLKNVREIVQDIPTLFSSLRRTEESFIGELDIESLAARLSGCKQVLCIVNTRSEAREIYEALPESEGNYHLSALMHPAHRTEILNEIREKLEKNHPCRVVSTQLIEAGVDVDFPCVYREISGIDSIAQAAGRCNRNGKSKGAQPVFIFQLPKSESISYLQMAIQSAKKLFDRFRDRLTSPECVKEYFNDYFSKEEQEMDTDGILAIGSQSKSGNIQFKEIANFQMIKSKMIESKMKESKMNESITVPVIIALNEESQGLVESLENSGQGEREVFRKLQRFTVQIYSWEREEIREWLEESSIKGIFILKNSELYSEKTGLQCRSPQGEAFIL